MHCVPSDDEHPQLERRTQLFNYEDFGVKESDIICSDTSQYLVTSVVNEGSFGIVAKCVDLMEKNVAIKIYTMNNNTCSDREISMLEKVRALDPVKTNIAHFFEMFTHKGHTCLAFEMLDRDLFQLLTERKLEPLCLSEIRPIAHQLLTAFDALKNIGVIHADLKLDNIMLVNHGDQPFRVKLIDFGVSLTTSEVAQLPGLQIQVLGFRAPEVSLGLPITVAIDMWSLGCVLASLYKARYLFGVNCEYEMIQSMVSILGQPADHLLRAGKCTRNFFKVNHIWDHPEWWLKTPSEYQLATGIKPKAWKRTIHHLDDLIDATHEQDSILLEDQRAFVSLLKCLLRMDPDERITPEKALEHPFVSMRHMADEKETSSYVEDSISKMSVCPVIDVDDEISKESRWKDSVSVFQASASEPKATSMWTRLKNWFSFRWRKGRCKIHPNT